MKKTKKLKGRWSTKGKKAVKVYSCVRCWSKTESPQKKADGMMYCTNCLVKFGTFEAIKQITLYVKK